jgi:ribosomal-protein-alanine N-acetyltransferase
MVVAETERLILRHFTTADGDAMDHIFGDSLVMHYGPGVQTRAWVRQWLRARVDIYKTHGFGLWAVFEKSTGQVIGYCGLSRFPDVGGFPETEIGYRLARPHWRRGFATEAARAALDHAFGTLSLPRLIALIDPANVASIRVAEKIGLRYEKDAMLPGYTHPDHVYSMANPAGG